MHSAPSIHPKSVVFWQKKKIFPGLEGAPSQKLYLKNGTVENFLNGGDGYPRVKLPKISHLFDNNLSLGVWGAPSQKPISQKQPSRKIFRLLAFSTFNCPKISHLFDISLSPGGSRGIMLSPGLFPNLTLLYISFQARSPGAIREINVFEASNQISGEVITSTCNIRSYQLQDCLLH